MTLDLKVRMEEEFIDIRKKLERAREKADTANLKVHNLETQQAALKSALDILDGNGPPTMTLGHKEARSLPWASISAPTQVVNGIIVEQGFNLAKDEQGNPTLIPIGINEPSDDVPPPPLPAMEIGDFAPDLPEAL